MGVSLHPGSRNGRYLPAQARRTVPSRLFRYCVAAGIVGCAGLFVGLSNWLVGIPPLLLFAGAVALAFLLLGWGPGLLALGLAILVTDFFFVHPTLELSMNLAVLRLALAYAFGAGLSWFVARRVGRTSPAGGSRHRSP